VVDPPPLPPRLTRVSTVIGLGTLLWIAATAVTALAGAPGLIVLTCVVGAGLGAVGWGIFTWQRAAVRRGSRTAQQGIET
jgi:Protein of unknown function (DUF2530)